MAGQASILVIDDEPILLTMLKLAFSKTEWSVDTAESAEEGLERFREKGYDLLLVDKNLPGMSGVELIREVRKESRSVAIILITGYPSADSARETLALGIDGYLEKPFPSLKALVELAEEALRRSASTAGTIAKKSSYSLVAACCGNYVRDAIVAEFGEQHTIHHVDSWDSLEKILDRQAPDAVFLEDGFDARDVVDIVRDLQAKASYLECVVIAEHARYSVMIRLIELQVRALIDVPPGSDEFQQKLREAVKRVLAD